MRCILLVITTLLLLGCKSRNTTYTYLAYTPSHYDHKETAVFPLMIFLHGSGERGNNIEKVKVHGPPKLIEAGKSFPCIVISPQCPSDTEWDPNKLNVLLDNILDQYRIDTTRIYLTGLSMGGHGTWSWSVNSPNRFAAIAPICGWGDPSKVNVIKDLPIWVFHGFEDEVIDISKSQEMVDALAELDNKVQFTVYPEAKHDSWTETYNNPKFYEWMFSQKRRN